jgi:hypothetical protein
MLRLSHPAKGNALNDAMIAGIESFFGDPPEETRTIILHAEGKHRGIRDSWPRRRAHQPHCSEGGDKSPDGL